MSIVDYESIKYNAYNIALLIIFLLDLVRLLLSKYEKTINKHRKKKTYNIALLIIFLLDLIRRSTSTYKKTIKKHRKKKRKNQDVVESVGTRKQKCSARYFFEDFPKSRIFDKKK